MCCFWLIANYRLAIFGLLVFTFYLLRRHWFEFLSFGVSCVSVCVDFVWVEFAICLVNMSVGVIVLWV